MAKIDYFVFILFIFLFLLYYFSHGRKVTNFAQAERRAELARALLRRRKISEAKRPRPKPPWDGRVGHGPKPEQLSPKSRTKWDEPQGGARSGEKKIPQNSCGMKKSLYICNVIRARKGFYCTAKRQRSICLLSFSQIGTITFRK